MALPLGERTHQIVTTPCPSTSPGFVSSLPSPYPPWNRYRGWWRYVTWTPPSGRFTVPRSDAFAPQPGVRRAGRQQRGPRLGAVVGRVVETSWCPVRFRRIHVERSAAAVDEDRLLQGLVECSLHHCGRGRRCAGRHCSDQAAGEEKEERPSHEGEYGPISAKCEGCANCGRRPSSRASGGSLCRPSRAGRSRSRCVMHTPICRSRPPVVRPSAGPSSASRRHA